MRSRWGWAALVATVGAAFCAGNVMATPPAGLTTTLYGPGALDPVNLTARATLPSSWNARVRTHGLSDVYVADNTLAPGGTTGWHTHPGPSFVIVTQGSVTAYDEDDPTCTPHVYTANTPDNAFVDPGGGHVHLLRDESGAAAQTIAVQLVPAGADRRQDAPAPSACPPGVRR